MYACTRMVGMAGVPFAALGVVFLTASSGQAAPRSQGGHELSPGGDAYDRAAEDPSEPIGAESAASPAAYLSPGGILPHGRVAYFVEGDTELPGYPAVFVGVRRGAIDWFDYGVAVGGIDTLFVARLHGKARLFEDAGRRWFVGLRLRLEFKRHQQTFSDFPPLDDFGFTVVPEVSVARRFGDRAEHALYYAAHYTLDIDVRQGRDLQHYVMVGMVGYEYRFAFGLHLSADVALGTELANPLTEGMFFPRFRFRVGYDL